MALNCPRRAADGEPCGECEDCSRIWGGHTSLDVVEIDAASNRGVDDARELRERAMYAPSEEERYKVYILDEAHMLTREAWNALLKILEEPPPRVIFVFATTEARKIQQTASPILSRCQRFDFRRIGTGDIMRRLHDVLDSEGIAGDPEALRAIARKANGGMRDGLSLLDQVLALSDEEVSVDTVVRVLGVVAEERYLELFDLVAEHRHGAVFDFVETLIDEGHDLVEFYHGLAEKLRLLLRLSLDPDFVPGSMTGEMRDAYARRAEAFSPGDLVRMLAMSSGLESDGSLRRTGRPRVLIEMLLLRMSYMDRTVELEEVIRALGGRPRRNAAARAGPRPEAYSRGPRLHPPPGPGRPPWRKDGGPWWRTGSASDRACPPFCVPPPSLKRRATGCWCSAYPATWAANGWGMPTCCRSSKKPWPFIRDVILPRFQSLPRRVDRKPVRPPPTPRRGSAGKRSVPPGYGSCSGEPRSLNGPSPNSISSSWTDLRRAGVFDSNVTTNRRRFRESQERMMTNIQQLMKMGQQLQNRIEELQDSLQTEELAASSGGGMVTARVTGKGDLKSITIDREVIDPEDPEMLEDLVVAAVAEAQNRARDFSEERMRGAAGGLPVNLPGVF